MAYVVRATNTGSSAKQRKERSHHWKRRKGRRLEGDRRRQLPPLLGRHKVLLLVELAYTSTVSAVTAGNPALTQYPPESTMWCETKWYIQSLEKAVDLGCKQ